MTKINNINHLSFIGLGSNLNNPDQQIATAIDSIKSNKNINILKKSKLYLTKPYGYTDQNDFINAVVKINTSLSCLELLSFLQSIELNQQRLRDIKWGPRTIDLDILCFDNLIINNKDIVIPHPDLKNRLFVLEPWAEIEPEWLLPDGLKIVELLNLKKLALADLIHQ